MINSAVVNLLNNKCKEIDNLTKCRVNGSHLHAITDIIGLQTAIARATDEDIIILLTNQGYISPIGANDGAIYTDNNGKLYIL